MRINILKKTIATALLGVMCIGVNVSASELVDNTNENSRIPTYVRWTNCQGELTLYTYKNKYNANAKTVKIGNEKEDVHVTVYAYNNSGVVDGNSRLYARDPKSAWAGYAYNQSVKTWESMHGTWNPADSYKYKQLRV